MLRFLLSVDSDEIVKLGSLFTLTNINNDTHDDIFQGVFTLNLAVVNVTLDCLGDFHDIVARELILLLQDLVLVYE